MEPSHISFIKTLNSVFSYLCIVTSFVFFVLVALREPCPAFVNAEVQQSVIVRMVTDKIVVSPSSIY